jgi:hypothetical protein
LYGNASHYGKQNFIYPVKGKGVYNFYYGQSFSSLKIKPLFAAILVKVASPDAEQINFALIKDFSHFCNKIAVF